MASEHTKLKKAVLVILQIMLVGGIGAFIYLKNLYPDTLVSIEGQTKAPVKVYRDSNGNVQIIAENMEDLAFAQGYMEGMDRLYQCDMYRRATGGKLSEIMGEESLADDFLMRVMFNDTIERTWENVQKDEWGKAILDQYCRGINYYIQTHKSNLPMEYKIMSLVGVPLDYVPANFTPQDVLRMILTMGMLLTYMPNDDVCNYQLIKKLGWGNFSDLLNVPNNNIKFNSSEINLVDPPTVKDTEKSNTFLTSNDIQIPIPKFQSKAYQNLFSNLEAELKGSNNWAVAPNKTKNNATILSNDPHLDIGTPGIMKGWHLIAKDIGYNAIGTQVPLAPLLCLGRTDYVSWGVTTTIYDTTDTWVETLNDDYSQYFYNGSWRDTVKKTYSFNVSGKGEVKKSIIEIPNHGVLMNIQGYRLALRWGSYNDASNLTAALFRMNMAKDLNEFKKYLDPLTGWDHILQNVVCADKYGNIGFVAAGKIPIRNNNKSYGIIPLNGTDPNNDWAGWIPFNQLPQAWNPTEGFVCSANSRTKEITNSYPYYLSYAFYADNRQERIEQVLNASNQHDIDTMNSLQCDTLAYYAPDVKTVVTNLVTGLSEGIETNAFNAFKDWNCHFEKDSVGASIYNQFLKEVKTEMFTDEFTKYNITFLEDYDVFLVNNQILNMFIINGTELLATNWFDNINTIDVETRTTGLKNAFKKAVASLADKYSTDVSDWQWGKVYPTTFEHPLGSAISILSFFNNGPVQAPGGDCVRARTSVGGQSLRFIGDFSGTCQSSLIVPPGASGILVSPWYKNQVSLWAGNSTNIIPGTTAAVESTCKLQVWFK